MSLDRLRVEPTNSMRLLGLSHDLLTLGDLEQESDVMVFVGRLRSPSRDPMNVQVENCGPAPQRQRLKAPKAGFFFRLPNRAGQHVGVSVGVPTELKPAIQFPMMCKKCSAGFP